MNRSLLRGAGHRVQASGTLTSDAWTEVEVDFGTAGLHEETFEIADGTVTSSDKVAVTASGQVGTSRDGSDSEWDQLICTGIPGAGTLTITVTAYPGPVEGKRKLIYQVAAA